MEASLHQAVEDLRWLEEQLSAPLHVRLSSALKISFSILSATKRNVRKCVCLPQTPVSLSLSSRIPCSSYTAQINLSSRHKSIFFSSQVSHTHTRADSALWADTCWPQSPTPLLHSLFHHTTAKVLKRLSLGPSECPPCAFLFPEQRLSALGEDVSLELLADQYYTGLKLDLQSDKSTSAAVSPTHDPLKIYFFFH